MSEHLAPDQLARRVAILAGIAFVHVAYAQDEPALPGPEDREIRLDLRLGHTDNLGRDSSNVPSGIKALAARFMAAVDRSRVDGAIVGNIEYRKYAASQILDDSELIGAIDGNLIFHMVPDVFMWDIQENLGQARTNPLAPLSPGNRELTTVVSTGPRLNLPVGQRNVLQLSRRQSERRYENSTRLDSTVRATRLFLARSLTPTTRINLTVDRQDADYVVAVTGYRLGSASIGYDRELPSGAVELSIGRGEIRLGAIRQTSAVGRFAWDKSIGVRSRFSLWASREPTDSGETFRLGGLPATSSVGLVNIPGNESAYNGGQGADSGTNDARLSDIVLTSNPAIRSTVGARTTLVASQWTLGISAERSRDEFEADNSFDNRFTRFGIAAGRSFGRQWSGTLNLAVYRQVFVTSGVRNRDRSGGIALTRSVGKNSSLSISYESNHRDSGFALYDEGLYFVSFGHDFIQ